MNMTRTAGSSTRRHVKRTPATLALVGALFAVGATMAPSASAAVPYTDIHLTAHHNVGVYEEPTSVSWKTAPDVIAPYGYVTADCWKRGQTIDNMGNVWYHVFQEHYTNGSVQNQYGYVYGAYADGNATFHNKTIVECPW
ncbi:hypothetical protein [Streptomyces mobaraensis]|uniref:SH3 domain-containing protein n=1 Tax=Streptomyces mobaraensis TaxID=35621 RepID=A0A5N5W5Z6_STRMB|nr:hypothetical protein [Streptomyces mobaraensis]KAB7840005.1 hypothetical protein FRZ00_21070 [Streptomyces mobaraensis]